MRSAPGDAVATAGVMRRQGAPTLAPAPASSAAPQPRVVPLRLPAGHAHVQARPARPLPEAAGAPRLAKFIAIGVCNTVVTMAVFHVLAVWLGVPAAWANIAGWLVGFANSFVWNRRWTFADRRWLPTRRVMLRFAVSTLLALGVSSAVILGLQALVPYGPHGALALDASEFTAMLAALAVNYTLAVRWAFAAPRRPAAARARRA